MDKKIKRIKQLSLILFITVMVAAIVSIFSIGGTPIEVESIHGETFNLHNHGVYRYDTVSVAMQAIAQDFVTVIIWGSLLIFALIKLNAKNELSKLLLLGLLGYSFYAYMSYSFLSHFNELFLLYVFNMSLSLYLLIRSLALLDMEEIKTYYQKPLPIKRTVTFLLVVGLMLSLMWLARILPGLKPNTQPEGLETYHTLVIQAMDLGFIVPLSFLSAYYLIKRTALGYILTSILLFKGAALFTAVATMALVQAFMDESANYVEIGIFLVLTAIAFYISILFFSRSMNTKKPLEEKI
jgi:hypothetical protein